DIATIAATLNVAHVLAGSVNRSGERVRISARLVDTNGRQVWSQAYDSEFQNILVLQNEIVTAVAKALTLTQTAAAMTQAPSFRDVRAYERFLQGRFFYNRREPADLERAERYYREALEIDSGYARAWSGVAAVYFIRIVQEEIALEAGLAAMQEAVEQALLLDPGSAEAHMRAAQLHFLTGDTEAAASHRRSAAALDPNDPLVLSAEAGDDAFEGRFDEAIEQQRRAVELDPLGITARNNLAYFLLGGGRYADAQAQFQKVLEINPDASEAVTEIGFILILQRRFEEAFAAIEKWPDGHFRDKGLALVCHSLGRRAEADEAIGRLLPRKGADAALELAEVYAWRGELDEAFRWLTLVLDEIRSDSARFKDRNLAFDIRLSGFLEPLRDDPRWDGVLA
ncbi:MAG: FlgO family outer membrane protein, partial [Woeseiaceae bacterium]